MTFEDDEIRSRLRVHDTSARSAVPVVLEQLWPRLRRARRRRRIVIGTTAVVLIGATGAALQSRIETSSSPTVRTYSSDGNSASIDERSDEHTARSGPADRRDPSSGSDRTSPSERSERSTSERSTATTIAEPPTSTSASQPASPGVGVPATPIPGPNTSPAAEPPIVEPTSPTDDTAEPPPPTSTPAPAPPTGTTRRIDSACGAVVVQTIDGGVELVEVLANPGFAVDVKSDGPDNVEVGLHGGNDECELKARIVAGQLVTEVHGPGGDDEPADD